MSFRRRLTDVDAINHALFRVMSDEVVFGELVGNAKKSPFSDHARYLSADFGSSLMSWQRGKRFAASISGFLLIVSAFFSFGLFLACTLAFIGSQWLPDSNDTRRLLHEAELGMVARIKAWVLVDPSGCFKFCMVDRPQYFAHIFNVVASHEVQHSSKYV